MSLKGNFQEMLKKAQIGKYAVPAFNFDNLEILKGIIAGAEQQKAPVIIMVTASAVKYIGLEYTIAIANIAISNAKVPVVLHLDHCFDPHFIITKITHSFDSVMLDYSQFSLSQNIKETKKIVEHGLRLAIAVEAEIGHVGGKEDDNNSDDNAFTNVDEAIKFLNETNVAALAISVGTKHGEFKGKPILQIGLIKAIANITTVPLVLHGASGIDDQQLAAAIDAGIAKVNLGTDLKIAYANSLKNSFKNNPKLYDGREFGQAGIAAVQAVVETKIKALRADNKAFK